MKDPELDLDFVRKQFPAFTSSKNSSLVFFENAGGSYVPKTVVDRLNRFFVEHKMQPYGASKPSSLAGEEMEESYRAIAQLINAQPNELTFGPSTTLNFYVLARGLRHLCSAGDEIIVTDQDHEANIGVWRRWHDSGIAIREWRIQSDTGELDIDDLKKLKATTRLIVQFLVAFCGLFFLGGLEKIDFGLFIINNFWVCNILAVLAIVWHINLFNFLGVPFSNTTLVFTSELYIFKSCARRC